MCTFDSINLTIKLSYQIHAATFLSTDTLCRYTHASPKPRSTTNKMNRVRDRIFHKKSETFQFFIEIKINRNDDKQPRRTASIFR